MKTLKNLVRITLGLLFIAASSLHFISDTELKIIPPFLPWRRVALYVTGACEILGGIGLLIPRFKRPAAWGLVALLIAIYPANVYQAIKKVDVGVAFMNTSVYHWIRLPSQAVFIWSVLWCTSDAKKRR